MTILSVPETDRVRLANGLEDALHMLHASSEALQADLNKLAIQVERLLKERAVIVDVLSQFYRSDISIASLQPLMDLAVQLNPTLKEAR